MQQTKKPTLETKYSRQISKFDIQPTLNFLYFQFDRRRVRRVQEREARSTMGKFNMKIEFA